MSLIARPTTAKIVVDPGSGGISIDDKNLDACYKATGRFAGLDESGERSLLFGYWSSSTFLPAVPLTPTARQRAAGQQWLACATYLTDLSDVGRTSPIGYQGSLRNAESTGGGRDYLGYCPDKPDWNEATSMSCRSPHHGEIFGIGGLSHDVARATLTSSCVQLVEQVTKSPDLVRDGQLIVDVQVTDMKGKTLNGVTIPKGSNLQCGVVTGGGRMLQGSLIAIGTEPIPWA
ncbi:MAG: hypothetical protein M3Y77_16860 [Actinomycetota bacterium]|nr:hypothetical protein [Actinomycetota bacterium]